MPSEPHSFDGTRKFLSPDFVGGEPHEFTFNWPSLDDASVVQIAEIEQQAAAIQDLCGYCRKKASYLATVQFWLDHTSDVPEPEKLFVGVLAGALVDLANDNLDPVIFSPNEICDSAEIELDSMTAALLRCTGGLH